MNKVILALSLSFILIGCTTTTSPNAPIVNILAPTPPVPMPQTNPIVIKPVQWKVYTLTELKKLVASGGNVLLFTLDANNFKALGDNLTATDGFIQEQNKAIQFLFTAANAPANLAKASAANATKASTTPSTTSPPSTAQKK